ncbi:hypothetical protein RND81_10G197400 [Saponaria officinalis]|uniref:RNA polymerase II C-terminal domain phosphatase-like n=1 Tax=Saponaria officinalis TaxID=3572 RepID=A0AAW1I6S7_SAPOF
MGGINSNYNQEQRVLRRIMKPRDPRPCPHLWFDNNSCLNCGKKLLKHQVRVMPYFKFNKNVTHNRTNLINVETKTNIQNPKKICLVLDLDHTLLNSTSIGSLSLEEDYLKKITVSPENAYKRGFYRLDHMGIMTKLRPFVRTFLEEANKMFEMCIYTMGDRAYALEMAKLLDPENKYFNSRIISRDDCKIKYEKCLSVIQKPENEVLILDDTSKVWPNNKDNLILMDRYMYFSSGCHKLGYNCKSLAELKRDEIELDGALSSILQVLKRIHRDYNNNNSNNVRCLLKESRKEVLKGCKIVFSGVIKKNNEVDNNHKWWKMAEELGATCTTEVESSLSHVVAIDGGVKKSLWGVKECKFVVNPKWIEAAYYL